MPCPRPPACGTTRFSGKLHDGLNEITLGFDTLANQLWSNVVLFKMEMAECEDDKDLGTGIVIR